MESLFASSDDKYPCRESQNNLSLHDVPDHPYASECVSIEESEGQFLEGRDVSIEPGSPNWTSSPPPASGP